jgi:chromosome segregation ATPase
MIQRAAIASLLIVLASTAAQAQTQRSGGGDAQKFMQQYQQLAAEKTALQGQVTQLKKDLDTANAGLAAAKKERDALKAHSAVSAAAGAQLAQAAAARQSAEKSLEQNKQKTTELLDHFKETVGTLKGVESDRAQLQRDTVALHAAFDKCAIDNTDLYDIAKTVLDRYDHVGFFTKVSLAEPITKITRTRMENLVDEYRARTEELRVKKPAP